MELFKLIGTLHRCLDNGELVELNGLLEDHGKILPKEIQEIVNLAVLEVDYKQTLARIRAREQEALAKWR